jgi:hypothetical protein
VVAGYLLEDTLTQTIDAGVPDVPDYHLAADADHGADRGAHSREFRVVIDSCGEFLTGSHDACKQGFSGLIDAVIGSVESIEVLNRNCAGDVSASVATHAIGDDEKIATN